MHQSNLGAKQSNYHRASLNLLLELSITVYFAILNIIALNVKM